MRTRLHFSRFAEYRLPALFGVGVLCLLLAVAVFATNEERTLHVFPTGVVEEGWVKGDRALEQALSQNAIFSDFTSENSASLVFSRDSVRASERRDKTVIESEVATEPAADETENQIEEQGNSEDQESENPETGNQETENDETQNQETGNQETENQAQTDEESAPEESVDETEQSERAEETSVGDVPAPITDTSAGAYLLDTLLGRAARAQETTDGNQETDNQEPGSDETENQETENQKSENLEMGDGATENEDSGNQETGNDETENEETENNETGNNETGNQEVEHQETGNEDIASQETRNNILNEEDVRVCTVLDIPCHTITFEGFDIGDILADHAVKGYELRLSLAARAQEGFTADKVLVRYFFRGSWHLAGELTLDRELSNFDNGGHFAFPLPNLTAWDALRDFKVELEYVRHSTGESELYLDSVWVDTTYEANATDEEVPLRENVLPELAVLEDSGRPDLLLAEDERIELLRTDAVPGDELVVRSDQDVYDGLTTARAYVSVTNTSDRTESFTLVTRTGKQGEVVGVLERMKNVPQTNDTPEWSEVAYYCEAGWEEESGSLADAAALGDVEPKDEPDEAEVDASMGDVPAGGGVEPASDVVDEGAGEGVPQEEGTSVDDEAEPLENDEELAQADTETPEDDATIEDSVDQRIDESEATDVAPAEELETLYRCAPTGETERCSSLNGDGTNCIKAEERVGVREEVAYTQAWQPLELRERTERRSSLLSRIGLVGESGTTSVQKLPYAKESTRRLTLMPRETRYFAVDLSFTVQRAGEFMVEALGEEAEAQRTMWWRSGFTRRVPITVSRAHDVTDTSLPVLYRIRFDTTHQDFFERAALDGRDVRFYDSTLRLELPSREVGFRYVDSEAEYLVELGEGRDLATSSLFVYFGNGEVDERARHAAPSITDEPIEYFGLDVPLDGAALTITSERDDNALLTQAFNEPYALAHGQERDLVVDNEVRVAARGPVRVRLAEGERARGTHGFTLSLPEHTYTSDRTTLGVPEVLVERYASVTPEVVFGEVEELPVPAVSIFEPLAFADQLARVNYLRQLAGPAYHDFLESLKDFALGDEVVFKLRYKPQKWGVTRFFRGLFRERLSRVGGVRLLFGGAPVSDARFGITYGAEGEWTLTLEEKPREMVPGKYTIELTIDELGTVYTDTFDFYWGVLVVNTPQATYAPNDDVEFHMAALDDVGDTICDAELRLLVTPPVGEPEEVFVQRQSTCGPNNVTDDPDYRAWYTPRESGRYRLLLTHVNLEGDIVHQTSDAFEVREGDPFTIERSGATRIWPKAKYRMDLTVTAAQDFEGEVVEALPRDFVLTDLGGAETEVWGGAKHLIWEVSLKTGETQTFSYEYDAPDISPYLYLLGPVEVRAQTGLPFVEGRQWKLASDALAQYTETYAKWSATAADTWETKDLSGAPFNVPANAILEIGLVNKAAGNERSVGVRAEGSSNDRRFTIHEAEPSGTDVTIMHVQASATSSIQHYADVVAENEFILLGYWTSGTYVERWDTFDPATINAWTNWSLTSYGVGVDDVAEVVIEQVDEADRIAGVREYGSTLNRYINTHEAEAGGVDTVTMWVRATSSTTTVQYYQNNAASIRFRHVGFFSVPPEGMTYQEHFDTVSGPSGASTWEDLVLDAQGVTRKSVVTVLVGNSAEANNSMTLGARKNGSALSRIVDLHEAESAGAGAGENYGTFHVQIGATGSSTIEVYSSDLTNDSFRILGRWKPINEPPDPPTLHDVPFDNEKTGSSTPYFEFTANDPDGASDLVYEFQWDDDADLDSGPLGDRTSDDESGCSPNCFTNTENSGDSSPFTEGQRIRFSLESVLTTGTTYYWRVRAKDTTGSGLYSEWSELRSVTYVADTAVKAWLQSEDAQFDGGTLLGAETYGEDAVRISADPPEGAMVAYGVGASTTPNIRTWSGTDWSATSSAQDVGGQISWTVLRAAPTRNEYLLGTQDVNGDVNVQVYDGVSGTWGDLFEIGLNASTTDTRAFDIAYRTESGDAVVVVCERDMDPVWAVWNGSGWTATSTIDITFTPSGCMWASLAASPASDEVILLTQANSYNVGLDFEALVLAADKGWDSETPWSDSQTVGNNTVGEDWAERMNVIYEEDGTEAIIAVGNGGTSNPGIVGYVWNTVTRVWTAYTGRQTQDDFQWGELVRKDGTNDLGLCYMDHDAIIQIANWNGTANAWDTYGAGTYQVDGDGNGAAGYHNRSVSCQYEITAGRNGYLMIPFSDENYAQYRVWTGSGFATAKQSITANQIQEAWSVGSARTGDGKILTVFRDDVRNLYDSSYWNGTTWSERFTFGYPSSDSVQPFAEPIMVAAARYKESVGTIVSPIVEFDAVPNRMAWGEALWSVTEPTNTSVTVQVLWAGAASSTCTSVIPDEDLPGNEDGFTATSSPVNLSTLATTTDYSRLCLKATLSSNTDESPTLNDWALSWERQPYLTQTHYKWFANTNSSTPTDVWPPGANIITEDEAIPAIYAPSVSNVLRLRLGLLDSNVSLSAQSKKFRLQWAEGTVCDASLAWEDVGAIGSSAPWRGYNNASPQDGATLSTTTLSTTDVLLSYEEENDTATNTSSIAVAEEAEFDFVLQHNATSSTGYCFRLVNTDGTTLNAYDRYPQLVTNAPPGVPTLTKPFTFEALASSSPGFTFTAEDGKGDPLDYQIEIDDDPAFGSQEVVSTSENDNSEFKNMVSTNDLAPFTSGETVRFIPTGSLPDGTYWWRVRARDTAVNGNGSGEWGEWSTPWSFTASSTVAISTWHQTTFAQFDQNTHEETEATSTDDTVLTPPATEGTSTSPMIDFDWRTTGNAWGALDWVDAENAGDIKYHIEYYNQSTGQWALVPDAALPNNATGHDTTQPVSLLSLDPTVYKQIRVRANIRDLGGIVPRLNSWTISWGLAVEQPVLDAPFDNEKVATTTPSFTFVSSDPQGDALQYEFQWSTTSSFSSASSTLSGPGAFVNTASTTDTSPFVSGDMIRFTATSGSGMLDGGTYWWRVRARDELAASPAWSVWSVPRSITIDTAVVVSTWHQTSDNQFDTSLLNSTETNGAGGVRINQTVREAMAVYIAGANTSVPRYRLWNGQAWGTSRPAQTASERVDWVKVEAAPKRDEYMIVTQGLSGAVKAQVYAGGTASWGNATSVVPAVANGAYRGFDVAYESISGKAMVVACTGQNAVYARWDGSVWTGGAIDLTIAQNCEWIQLAADTNSNEMILMARMNSAGTADYEALVWNGSTAWGNSTLVGNAGAATDEGMAVMYEESGTDAVIVFSNGTNVNFGSKRWNAGWQATTTTTIGGAGASLNKAMLCRDQGTDRITVAYTNENTDIGFVEWDPDANVWGSYTILEVDGVNEINNEVTCQYETTTGRDGYVLFTYGDGVALTQQYRIFDRSTPVTLAQNVSTLGESYSSFSARTGDGKILGLFYDDDINDYLASTWDGQWSSAVQLEGTGNTQNPRREPLSIAARRYTEFTSGSVVSDPVVFTDGTGPRWGVASSTDTTDEGYILYQLEYSNDGGETWALIPIEALPGNNVGTTSNSIDLSNVSYATYGMIRYVANFVCVSGDCPTLHDWTIAWSEGITISGTIKEYDESTPVTTSGDVRVAVNGVLQPNKIGTVSGGTWSIANVTMFPGDVITVFVDGVGDMNEAAAVTRYDGFGNMTGIELFERHLTVGSPDATTTTNANIALYDYTASADEDLFFDVDAGNDLYVSTSTAGYFDAKLYVATTSTYRPDSANSGTLYAHDVVIHGTVLADTNTFYVNGSWDNNGSFSSGNGTVVFTATSSLETIDSSGASDYAFNTLTLGQSMGAATWTLASLFDVNRNMTLSYGTLVASTSDIAIGGNLSLALGTTFLKGTGTTTFDGATTPVTITDATANKQDLGKVSIQGTAKSVALQSGVKLTDLTIAAANTFSVSALHYPVEVRGSFRNFGSFSANQGTVTFTATSTGIPIYPGTSAFWNLTMNGVGGNWYFEQTEVTIGNTLTVATGTLTLALGTTTISGNLANTGGVLQHNDGTVELAGTGAKTLYQNGSPLFNLTVSGGGSWSWVDQHATTSGTVRMSNGTLRLPAGTLAVGKSFEKTAGTLEPNGGTLRFTSNTTQTLRSNGSPLFNLTFDAPGGTYVFSDTNLTATGTVRFVNGTTTLPSGTLTVGGSFLTTGGTWQSNNGTVLFNAPAAGNTVAPGTSTFNNVTFNNASGGWTVSASATSTGAWTITSAANFTAQSGVVIEVGGTFVNESPAATLWDGSTLYLNSGTNYTVGSKSQAAEGYGTLRIGPGTDIRMWQASSSAYAVDPTGSLYSQDHAGNDGDLYIYGTYERTSGADYWSYSNDFDGTGIGGSPRQVDVRFASNASARFTGTTLQMVGGASASTTVSNQGSGSFGLSVTDGTVTAQYYTLTNMDMQGFSILGSSTVTSLSDGAFILTAVGASSTMLTVSSTTIDANPSPSFEIQRVSFSTSTGSTEGFNATASGTASSYWLFRNHTGNFDGEDHDSDPVAGAGSLRWDDSGFSVDISGTLHADEGAGGAPAVCNGSTDVLRLVVAGVDVYDTHCDTGTGAFTFDDVTYTGDVSLIAFVFGTTTQAATVSRSPQSDITDFDLYAHRVIVRHEGVDPLTIATMLPYDRDQNSDIPFDAEAGALTVLPETGLHVWEGTTFAPGGTVTLLSGGSGASYDGTLRLADTSTFAASGSETHSIGGSFIANSSATFTSANETVDFTATTSGKTIASSDSFYNVTFSGLGGGWTLASSTTVTNNLAMNSGTLSGTANLTVQNGSFTGNGTVTLTGGTATVGKGGNFGGANAWTFNNLTLGDGTTNTTTKVGSGNMNVTGALTIAGAHTLQAGSAVWTFTGSGTVLTATGAFVAQTSTTTFAGTGGMTVPALTYNNLVLAPAAGGGPTYILSAGNLTAATLTVGDGTNPVTVQANNNDPLLTLSGTFRNRTNATFSAASNNDILVGGSYLNQGTFTANGGGFVLNSSDTGEVVDPGASAFHHLTLAGAGGGWTMLGSATTTGNFTLTAGTSYEQSSGTTLLVQGIFTNSLDDSATDWTDSTLYLNSGTSYSANVKTSSGDSYGTLRIGANTDVKIWNSTSTVYQVDASGSLYSQDHNGADGELYLWGDYLRSSGTEHWSYATDFDGTDLTVGSLERTVSVYLAAGASTTLSGGAWNITGASGATTTIASQGGGVYGLKVTAGTFSAQYYRIRGINALGLEFSGSPTVQSLSDGDLELALEGGSMMTIAGSVITANDIKTWDRISFATSTGISSGYNITSTGVSTKYWRFRTAQGNFYGETHDNDSAPAPDPGYLIWDDSNSQISISGNVYSDETGTVSGLCTGANVVTMVLDGASPQTTSCAPGTGLYTFSNISMPVGVITVYLDDVGTTAAHVLVDPALTLTDMHLYENRVVVRHEDVRPVTIARMAGYDSSDDPDVPFTATDDISDTLTLPANRKLIVWSGKTFTPGGNVTLLSGGSGNDYDGTLELQANARLVASSTIGEAISVGGSWLTGSGALFTAGLSTVTFTATTSGKTISPDSSPFYNLTFNGSGGAWTFTDANATSTVDTTITAGSVTLATSTFAVGGAFVNSGTLSAASTTFRFNATTSKNVTFNGADVGSLLFLGSGVWTMTDTNATSTGSVTISSGTVNLPTGTFAVAHAFNKTGGSFTHAGTLRLFGSLAAQTLRLGGSNLRNLTVAGSGSWAFADTYATTTGTTTIAQGGLTAPATMLSVGGSFINAGIFNSNAGTLYFYATSTGHTLNPGGALLANVTLQGAGGGWTVATSATTTGAWRLKQVASFTMASSTRLEVGGIFENAVASTTTDWTDSTLYLNSGTSYSINTRTAGGDTYAYLTLGPNTDVRLWDSAASTTTVPSTSSLYSMDHAGESGDLYIWGEYVKSSGTDYWSYATDFEGGTPIGGSRPATIRIASSSSIAYTGGSLEIKGTASATTTVAVQGTGAYSFIQSGGTLDAQYYAFRNLDASGLVLTNPITVTSLSYGDFERADVGGYLLQIASTTIDQNPTKIITGVRFGTSTGVSGAVNIKRNGTSTNGNFWDFRSHTGEIDGEAYDEDGPDACGSIRWDDSTCLEVSQTHFRFRNDDGTGGAPDSEWYDANWNKRKRVNVTNPNTTALTDTAVRFDVAYETDDMQANYIDLRFTDSSGTTSLPFIVESYTAATATVWVKVPSIPANDTGYIYMYYDNDVATNAESGANTFLFYDDFEDDILDGYLGDTTMFDAVAESGGEGAYVLKAAAGQEENVTSGGLYQTGTTFGPGSTIRFLQYVDEDYEDQPCAFFGVGGSASNYAVCLTQYPNDRLAIAEDVTNRATIANTLASTSVTWVDGWYTVEVDWLSGGTMTAYVYDSSGALFASTTASDLSHTSAGGSGFSFWKQHGAWDFYTARPYLGSEPTVSVGLEQEKGGASWKSAQDASVTQGQGEPFRVRFSIANSGPQVWGKEWRLQYADKTGYGTCNAVPSVSFNDVPGTAAGCSSAGSPVCMTTTSGYADQDLTQALLAPTNPLPMTPGYLVERNSNQSASSTLPQGYMTEVEYAVVLTEDAISNAYCMRVSNGGLELDSYQVLAEVTANYGPQVNSFTLNSNAPIALIEGTTRTVVATGTVSDLNGGETLLYATSTFYRSGVGPDCTENPNNCYHLNSLQCPLNCVPSGTTCEVTCTADIEYFAEPTDFGSYSGETWQARLYLVDETLNEATSTTGGVELATSRALSVISGDIGYGALGLGASTTAYANASSSIQNTGNIFIDVELEGTDLTSGASSIPVGNQLFATSSFAYSTSSCIICTALSGAANSVELDLPKATATSSPAVDVLYWGIYIPSTGIAGTTHRGQTTFYAIDD